MIDAALAHEQARRRLPDGPTARFLRRRAGLTLFDVARAVGVSGVAVSLWERGLRRPREPQIVDAYARLLDRLAREVASGGGA